MRIKIYLEGWERKREKVVDFIASIDLYLLSDLPFEVETTLLEYREFAIKYRMFHFNWNWTLSSVEEMLNKSEDMFFSGDYS